MVTVIFVGLAIVAAVFTLNAVLSTLDRRDAISTLIRWQAAVLVWIAWVALMNGALTFGWRP